MANSSESLPNSVSNDYNSSVAADHLLPIAVVGRLMKKALPPGAKISKEAKETMQECATEFIGFVTGEASERCRREKRKTINGNDICCAFKMVGLDDYANAMQKYLDRYREHGEKGSTEKIDKSIQIDVRDELSVFRSEQSRKQNSASSARGCNEPLDGAMRFF